MKKETFDKIMASDENLEEAVRAGMAEQKEQNVGREAGEPSERTSVKCGATDGEGGVCGMLRGHEESKWEQNRAHRFFNPYAKRPYRSKNDRSSSYGADPGMFGLHGGGSRGGFPH